MHSGQRFLDSDENHHNNEVIFWEIYVKIFVCQLEGGEKRWRDWLEIYVNAIEPLWIQTAIMIMMQNTMKSRNGGEIQMEIFPVFTFNFPSL